MSRSAESSWQATWQGENRSHSSDRTWSRNWTGIILLIIHIHRFLRIYIHNYWLGVHSKPSIDVWITYSSTLFDHYTSPIPVVILVFYVNAWINLYLVAAMITTDGFAVISAMVSVVSIHGCKNRERLWISYDSLEPTDFMIVQGFLAKNAGFCSSKYHQQRIYYSL